MNLLKSKKISCLLIAALTLALTACRQNNTNAVSTEPSSAAEVSSGACTSDTIFNSISENIVFNDTMEIITDDYAEMLLGISPSLYTDCVLYMGSGATAEELLIFIAASDTDASEISKLLSIHIEDQKTAFEGYDPEELQILSDAVIMANDTVVICCVSSDNAGAEKTISEFFAQ